MLRVKMRSVLHKIMNKKHPASYKKKILGQNLGFVSGCG